MKLLLDNSTTNCKITILKEMFSLEMSDSKFFRARSDNKLFTMVLEVESGSHAH